MFNLTTGSYRALEEQFTQDVLAQKKDDPFASVLILSPSGRLLSHLQSRLAEAKPGFLNINFFTFYALAARVMADRPPTEDRVVSDAALYREIIHDFLTGQGKVPYLSKEALVKPGAQVPKGLAGALASTLKDLQDSGARVVDCANAAREGHLGDKAEGAVPLLELNVLMYKVLHDRQLRTRADFFRRAAEQLISNAWVNQQKAIYLYGFYDLTGVQLDLIQAFAKHPNAAIYFPFENDRPAYAYAEKLLKDLRTKAPTVNVLPPTHNAAPKMEAYSCSGTQNEVWWAAKKVLEQADAGVPFTQMAVIARTLEPYLSTLREVFETHRIPYALYTEEPVGAHPLVKKARCILNEAIVESVEPWSAHVIWALSTLANEIRLPRDATPLEHSLWQGLQESIHALSELDILGKPVSWERFLEVVNDQLASLRLPLSPSNVAGVQVMDVMTARGLSFDSVFLLGLNEKLFPRLIREDPFLSDAARSALSQALGCRLGRKMDGFQEEKLLFELAIQQSSRHLHLSCQRSDEEGKALVISLYLHDFLKKNGLTLDAVPRAWPERMQKALPSTLTPKEVSIAYHRENLEPTPLYQALGWDRALLTHLLGSQKEIEAFGALGAHDGLIGEDNPVAKAILEHGLSPQSLKDLAECPFKVFSRKVLELYTDQGDVEEGQLTHTGRGKLIHKILQSFYQTGSKLNALETIAAEEFRLIQQEKIDLYPLAWQAEKARILTMIKRFLPLDLADQAATGFKPSFYETPLAAEIKGIKLQGRIDRLDLGKEGFRIVDYKSGSGGIGKKETVEAAIMKGKSFQLPVYLALAKTWLESQKNPAAKSGRAVFYRLDEENAIDTPLEIGANFWEEHGDRFYENLAFLVKNIESGTFYIRPSDGRGYCQWCDYKTICRKEHKPTQIRSENSVLRKKHAEAFTPPK